MYFIRKKEQSSVEVYSEDHLWTFCNKRLHNKMQY